MLAGPIRISKLAKCPTIFPNYQPIKTILLLRPTLVKERQPSQQYIFVQQTRLVSKKRIKQIASNKSYQEAMQVLGDDSSFEPEIFHGESVVDRKSVFQGHCAGVQRIEHVNIFLCKLKENKKIENAFHNMWAYRIDKSDPNAKIAGKSASIIQDCDDDGEQAAGGRLLSLLQILNVVNVMIVVTRWYGGIQLGPARFKHINNAARDSLVKGGFVNDGPQSTTSGDPKSSGSSKAAKSSNRKNKKK